MPLPPVELVAGVSLRVVEPDVGALRSQMQAELSQWWPDLQAWVEESYEREDKAYDSHYAWFDALTHAVLQPALDRRDAATVAAALRFALPLHGTAVGDAVQNRVLRWACRQEVAAALRTLLDEGLQAQAGALCEATDNGG